ncbi:MAG TPA: zf-HC2 domain-containing protein [Myxococcus sp.]|nr:zf-HC2 domain-containing protein [Myxococcus sp.]
MSAHCQKLYLFLDGELPPADEENFRRHLARCEACATGLHEAMQLELLCHQALGVDRIPEPPARARSPRRQDSRGRWGAGAGLALAAGLAAVFVLSRPWREDSGELWLARAPMRVLEARVAYAHADGHRPYVPMRGGSGAPAVPPPQLRDLADLEDAEDLHGIAAAYLVRKDLTQAQAFLLRAPPSVARDCDLAVIHLEKGQHAEALALLDGVLKQSPDHVQALWNRALVLREMGLTLKAAEAFDAVAKQGEPGWSEEAQVRARALRQQTLAPPETAPAGDRVGAFRIPLEEREGTPREVF